MNEVALHLNALLYRHAVEALALVIFLAPTSEEGLALEDSVHVEVSQRDIA